MRHLALTHSSTQNSFLHHLDARVKLIVLIGFVVSIALLRAPSSLQLAILLAALLVLATAARMQPLRLLRTALLVVPFVGFFSLIVYLSGDARRAWLILSKSYLSVLAVVLTAACTPLPELLAAGRFFRIPGLLIEVTQLIYRYLFVLTEQAQAMQTAFAARGGRPGRQALKASSGMIAVLFQASYEKALKINHAMQARAFTGTLVHKPFTPPAWADVVFLIAGLAFAAAVHFV